MQLSRHGRKVVAACCAAQVLLLGADVHVYICSLLLLLCGVAVGWVHV
jgi:hypothetical protein